MPDTRFDSAQNFRDDFAVFVRMCEVIPLGYGLWCYDINRDGAWCLPIPFNHVAAWFTWCYYRLTNCRAALRLFHLRNSHRLQAEVLREENRELKERLRFAEDLLEVRAINNLLLRNQLHTADMALAHRQRWIDMLFDENRRLKAGVKP